MGYQGVDLRGGDIGMAEHSLNGTEVSPTFQHMGGKSVPQGVRGNFFLYSSLPAVITQYFPEPLPGKTASPVVDKNPGNH